MFTIQFDGDVPVGRAQALMQRLSAACDDLGLATREGPHGIFVGVDRSGRMRAGAGQDGSTAMDRAYAHPEAFAPRPADMTM